MQNNSIGGPNFIVDRIADECFVYSIKLFTFNFNRANSSKHSVGLGTFGYPNMVIVKRTRIHRDLASAGPGPLTQGMPKKPGGGLETGGKLCGYHPMGFISSAK